ncbi:hypothetical protein, partial [Nocardioides sp.]|uniref:hypothetical protein n=1 Tax=Nocardioides sp. TaxID=35761 RepID=UPI002B276C9B
MSDVAQIATLAHGYTMDHIDRLAWSAARKYPTLDPEDAYSAAWHAMVELLYSIDAASPPTRFDLSAAAR